MTALLLTLLTIYTVVIWEMYENTSYVLREQLTNIIDRYELQEDAKQVVDFVQYQVDRRI